LAAEATAVAHGIRGPTAASEAWPLDGPIVGFELTPANEDAYFMHVAIRRAAAALRARSEEESREREEEDRGCDQGEGGGGHQNGSVAGRGAGAGAGVGAVSDRVSSAVKAAVAVASSPALLFTCMEMGDEESLMRECLSVYRSDQKERALRWV